MIRIEFMGVLMNVGTPNNPLNTTARSYIHLNPDQIDYICIHSYWKDKVEKQRLEIYLTSRCITVESQSWSETQLKEIEIHLVKAIKKKNDYFEVNQNNKISYGNYGA